MVKNIFLVEDDAVFHRHFSSDPIAVAMVIEALSDQFNVFHLSTDVMSNIEIVLSETINNINEHAYMGDTTGPIEILAERRLDKILFALTDCGKKLPGGKLPIGIDRPLNCDVQELPEGGFGWSLIHKLTTGLKYCRRDGENHLSFAVTIDPVSTI